MTVHDRTRLTGQLSFFFDISNAPVACLVDNRALRTLCCISPITGLWSAPSDIKRDFGTASILQDGRVVFNLAGNKYRLVVWVNYAYRVVYIRFIGTHAQYDKIDVQTI